MFLWTSTYGLARTDAHNAHEALKRIEEICPTTGVHLDKWWGLDRSVQVPVEAFFRVGTLFTADGGRQKEFIDAGVNHVWLPPGVWEDECLGGEPQSKYQSDIAFVGGYQSYHRESKHRFQLIDYLKRNYGNAAQFWPKPGQPAVRGKDLQNLYASVKILCGDSCLVPNENRYWSDRIPETLGRRGFLLHPYVGGIELHYTDGEHMRMWPAGDWKELDRLIRYYLTHDDERRKIAKQGQQHVLETATYKVRVQQIIDHLRQEGKLA